MKKIELNHQNVKIYDGFGNQWFCAKAVALALGYNYYKKAIKDYVDENDKKKLYEINKDTKLTHNDQQLIYINKHGLYSLILRSQLPKAKEFNKYVISVLPSIVEENAISLIETIYSRERISTAGHIYLLQEREFIKTNEPIYKLGKTKTGINSNGDLKRFKQYPNGSNLIIYRECDDCDNKEKELLSLFNDKFIQRDDIGREYFEGNYNIMKQLIIDNVNTIDDINGVDNIGYVHSIDNIQIKSIIKDKKNRSFIMKIRDRLCI